MAKMFYTMDETKAALGKSEDQIKELAHEGRLREFRDGARIMFKADQVETLKSELASGGEPLELSDGDSDSMISLSDESPSPAGSGAGLGLADTSLGGTKTGSSTGGAAKPADDTALASDLGLSGSISGMPSSGKAASSLGLSGSSHASRSGIDVFQTDETEKVDPSAATSIAPGINPDQISIESVGSGSGLLDLTRESDDTSLGAELMDEIAPSASGVRRSPGASAAADSLSASALTGSATGTGVGMAEPRGAAAGARQAPALVEAPDPMAPAFGLAALGAACVLLFAAFALVSGVAGYHPDILRKMGSSDAGGYSFIIIVGGAFVLPVVLFVAGLLMGRR
jgi:hypothetical protein